MLISLDTSYYTSDSFLSSQNICYNLSNNSQNQINILTCSLPKQISNYIQIITSLWIDILSATTKYRALAVYF